MTEPDSTFAHAAGLLGSITEQLGIQLGHVRPYGHRPWKEEQEVHPPMNTPCRATPALAGTAPLRPALAGTAPAVPTLVAVGHGSRDPRARATLARLLERVRELRPGLDVRLAHIELNTPLLDTTLAELAAEGRDAVLVPLLLAPGYHVTHDLPAALAAVPGLRARVAEPLGAHPLLVEALADRLAHSRLDPRGRRLTGRRGRPRLRRIPGPPIRRRAPPDRRPARRATRRRPRSPRVRLRRRAHRARGRPRPRRPGPPPGGRRLLLHRTRPLRHPRRRPRPLDRLRPLGAHPALARLVLHRYDGSPRATTRERELAAV